MLKASKNPRIVCHFAKHGPQWRGTKKLSPRCDTNRNPSAGILSSHPTVTKYNLPGLSWGQVLFLFLKQYSCFALILKSIAFNAPRLFENFYF